MLDFFDERTRPSRRAFLRVGALGLGGLTLADLLRLEAKAASGASGKSIIMVYLPGGPSHIDLYDMKPEAPVEIHRRRRHHAGRPQRAAAVSPRPSGKDHGTRIRVAGS
jgi:hypothetical protein